MSPATEQLSAFIAGVTAAEGCFSRTSGWPPVFIFEMGLGAVDGQTCELLRDFLGVGRIVHFARRKDHYDDEVSLQVRRLRDLVEIVVPFMDEHLLPSHKRRQYLEWRTQLLDYWENHARRRRTCTRDGCQRPQRAKSLCRRHYYQIYRR